MCIGIEEQCYLSQSKSFLTTTFTTICRVCVLKSSQYFYQTLGKPLVICSNLVCLLCFQKIHSNSINTEPLWWLTHTHYLSTAVYQLSFQESEPSEPPQSLPFLSDPHFFLSNVKLSPRKPHPPTACIPLPHTHHWEI